MWFRLQHDHSVEFVKHLLTVVIAVVDILVVSAGNGVVVVDVVLELDLHAFKIVNTNSGLFCVHITSAFKLEVHATDRYVPQYAPIGFSEYKRENGTVPEQTINDWGVGATSSDTITNVIAIHVITLTMIVGKRAIHLDTAGRF